MTKYAGESLLVTTTADDYDSDALDSDDVDGITITILNEDGDVIVSTTAMTWDAENSWWQYMWDTPTTAGYYYAKLVLTDLDDNQSIEYQKVRLLSPPV